MVESNPTQRSSRPAPAEAISVFASNTTHVILDINGYFVAATDPTALAFYPVDSLPRRRYPRPHRVARRPVAGRGSDPRLPDPLLVVRHPGCGAGLLTQFRGGAHRAARVSDGVGHGTEPAHGSFAERADPTVMANAAIVPAGTGGKINIFASNPTNLVIDINGYFAPVATGGLSLYNVTPCRVLDTRDPPGLPFSGKKDVSVTGGACGLPVTARAFVLSATVVPPGA